MAKILVIDTSVLCVYLDVPGMDDCGPSHDKWTKAKVEAKLANEKLNGSTFVLPLASIIETGNHISQSGGDRLPTANRLAEIMKLAAEQETPWAAFGEQIHLWSPEQLTILAETWPQLATQKLSIGDATIAKVADYYAQSGYQVEILTGDQGLKAHQPVGPLMTPRRRK